MNRFYLDAEYRWSTEYHEAFPFTLAEAGKQGMKLHREVPTDRILLIPDDECWIVAKDVEDEKPRRSILDLKKRRRRRPSNAVMQARIEELKRQLKEQGVDLTGEEP